MLQFRSFHESSPADGQRGHDDLQEEIRRDTAFIRKLELLIHPGTSEHQFTFHQQTNQTDEETCGPTHRTSALIISPQYSELDPKPRVPPAGQ